MKKAAPSVSEIETSEGAHGAPGALDLPSAQAEPFELALKAWKTHKPKEDELQKASVLFLATLQSHAISPHLPSPKPKEEIDRNVNSAQSARGEAPATVSEGAVKTLLQTKWSLALLGVFGIVGGLLGSVLLHKHQATAPIEHTEPAPHSSQPNQANQVLLPLPSQAQESMPAHLNVEEPQPHLAPSTSSMASKLEHVPAPHQSQAQTEVPVVVSPHDTVSSEKPASFTDTTEERDPSAELRSLDELRGLITKGRGQEALNTLDIHKQKYPKGLYVEEASYLELRALQLKQDKYALEQKIQSFMTSYPQSRFKGRVEKIKEDLPFF